MKKGNVTKSKFEKWLKDLFDEKKKTSNVVMGVCSGVPKLYNVDKLLYIDITKKAR